MQSLRDTVGQLWQPQYERLRSRLAEVSRTLERGSQPDGEGNEDKDEGLRLVSQFETLLVEFQSLLIWEKPYRTANALTLFTIGYW